jgi:nucleoside-specific outer membrane channel protein Tsx
MKIIKREIEVNTDEFIRELKNLSDLIKRHSPNTIGLGKKLIENEFGLKMTIGDFYKLMDECNLKLTRDYISFKTINDRYKEIEDGEKI